MPSDSLKSDTAIHYPLLSFQDNTNQPSYDITYDLPSTKCLGTFRTMVTASHSPTENRPLNPSVVFPPASLTSRVCSDSLDGSGSPRAFARLTFSFVRALRAVAIAFAISLVVVNCTTQNSYYRASALFVFFFVAQLVWLVLALLTQGNRRRRDRGMCFTVDFGFVGCIFRRRGRDNDDNGYERDGLLSWLVDDGGRQRKIKSLVYTAVDTIFAIITFTLGVVATSNHGLWHSEQHVPVAVLGIFVGVFEGAIAIAQQFAILKSANIQIMWDEDEETDLGSYKYRIRLPQSPEQRHTAMSVTA
ncbi:hypothetical protein CSHISOI_07253 [Colletotrichum shisoi]|uniref:Uncharacterized protein n=1 Tax=Colletotrichum shisoi TaxID=2078593 RepID=A0A5Q4BMI7_9PEZI|nr:hypothetical protein CSHISOI_07253 [Colletotrichum shisoi]